MTARECLHIAMSAPALAAGAAFGGEMPKVPVDFGPCPRECVPFLRYTVQRRAAEGLNRVKPDAAAPADVVIYKGTQEDANVAWIAAAAYRYPWSRYHESEAVRARAFALMDAIIALHPTGEWDDGGLNAYFGLQSFAWAVLEWSETGAVDAERMARWKAAVTACAEHAMLCMHYGPYRPSALMGQYANPEFYYLSGLAAAWRITGDERYRDEAAAALRRYDEWLYPGGGMAYFIRSQPQHGYQQMIVKSTALYWSLTSDPEAFRMLERLRPYFPNVVHRSGLLTDAEQPHLKHHLTNHLNPAVPVMLACVLNDGENRAVADPAIRLQADVIDQKEPSFDPGGHNWYNYHLTTYAAAALRLMEKHQLPESTPLPARRVFRDHSFNGVRSHWDDVTAAVGARQMNDSLAGLYLADPKEPVLPLRAAVDGVTFEVLRDWKEDLRGKGPDHQNQFRAMEWDPTVYHLNTDNFAAVSCLSRLCTPYWGDMPFLPGEAGGVQFSDWTTLQHWAVWRNALIGLGALRCHADGGDPEQRELARARWRLAPAGRELGHGDPGEQDWRVRWGGLDLDLTCLEQEGNFEFAADESQAKPYAPWSPVLTKPAPWSTGDHVHVATVVRPTNAEGSVRVRSLADGAATLLIEPDGKTGLLWVANLTRHWRQYLWDVPAGTKADPYKWDHRRMPPIPNGEPANTGLNGGESIVWTLGSAEPLNAEAILATLRAGKGRRR